METCKQPKTCKSTSIGGFWRVFGSRSGNRGDPFCALQRDCHVVLATDLRCFRSPGEEHFQVVVDISVKLGQEMADLRRLSDSRQITRSGVETVSKNAKSSSGTDVAKATSRNLHGLQEAMRVVAPMLQ